jgi:hypothetical protein
MAHDYLQLQDFFTAGLGFDLGGAFLLARGLISSPAQLNQKAGSFYGSNAYLAVSVARDRIDALSGVSALAIGFLLQTVGYLAILAAEHTERAGRKEAFVGAVLVLGALAITIVVGWFRRQRELMPTVVGMSRYTFDGTRLDYPQATLLIKRLEVLGQHRNAGEDDLAFAKRVSGVSNLIVEDVDNLGSRRRLWTDPPLPPRKP